MTWVKICGTTNLEDALAAVDAGADALGFVFYEKSPRRIDPETVRQIVRELPPTVEKVGVFAGESVESAVEIADGAGLTAVQIHLQPPAALSGQNAGLRAVCSSRVSKIYPAVPASWFLGEGPVSADLASFTENRPDRLFDTIFLDSGTAQQPGGTGRTFDWEKAATLVQNMSKSVRVVVAGGLTSSNVAEAMRMLRAWGVDVASGVEKEPGRKDREKIRAFVAEVRKADRKNT